MRRFDFVIFDCDGVLVDSEPMTNVVIRDNLARYGLELPVADVIGYFMGGTMMGIRDKAMALGAELPEGWIDEIYGEMFVALAAGVEIIPGVAEMLDRLDAAGIGYAVGSNGPHAKMAITLKRCGLWERLEGRIYSRQDVAEPKPAPDVYLLAASQAGYAPERCMVVEDSPSGAKAGVAAGMFTAGFVADTPASRLEPICDVLFERMDDLPGLLGLR